MKRGFTLVELLVSISIAAILFTIGYASFTKFNRRQILDQAAAELKSNLRMAQQKASSGEKSADCAAPLEGWFASFTTNSYSIYGLCGAYKFGEKTVDLQKRKLTFPSPLTNPIQFKPLSLGVAFGLNANYPSVSLTLAGYSLTKTVVVTSVGEIK